MHLLNQFLFNQFPEKQSNMLTSEVQKQITSVIMAKLDVIEQHFQNEISQKLTTTDKILKENIAQVCRSKVCPRKVFVKRDPGLHFFLFCRI